MCISAPSIREKKSCTIVSHTGSAGKGVVATTAAVEAEASPLARLISVRGMAWVARRSSPACATTPPLSAGNVTVAGFLWDLRHVSSSSESSAQLPQSGSSAAGPVSGNREPSRRAVRDTRKARPCVADVSQQVQPVSRSMAMTLHDPERLDTKTPLESSIARPPSFHVYRALLAAAFSKENVYLPYGLEDATNHPSIEAMPFGSKRPEAPLPCGSGSQSASSVGIRPMYSAFMAASWIVYCDARVTPAQFLQRGASVGAGKPAKEMIAHSMLSELTDAAKTGLSPGNALGRSTATTLGPHDSQRSRRIAATLLLPRVLSGRTRANRRDITFLDAFALITVSTNRPCFSVDPNGVPHSASDGGSDGGEAGRAVALTDMVRMSVVAGSGAVASFAKTLDIASTPMFRTDEWKRSAILCFSYVVGATVLHTPLVLDDCTGVDTVVQAVLTIQNAALREVGTLLTALDKKSEHLPGNSLPQKSFA